MTFSADQPELRLLAQLGGVSPARMAAAFSDPEQLLKHVTLEELARLKQSCDAFAALGWQLAAACDVALAALVISEPEKES